MRTLFKSFAILTGLSIAVSGFSNVLLSPTIISNPHTIAPHTKEVIYLDVSEITEGAYYSIDCVVLAQAGSKGAYGAFISKNLNPGAPIVFDGRAVTANKTLIISDIPASLSVKHVKIKADEMIEIENRDGAANISVSMCVATPEV